MEIQRLIQRGTEKCICRQRKKKTDKIKLQRDIQSVKNSDKERRNRQRKKRYRDSKRERKKQRCTGKSREKIEKQINK